MIVEELVGRIGLDFTGAQQAAQAVKSISSITGALGAVGGIMLATKAAFEALAIGVADEVGDMKDFGDAVGISVQAIQGLGAAAIPTGASMEDVTVGLRKLADSAANAAKGNEAAEDSFAGLGVRVTDARGRIKPLETLLNDVSNGLSRIKDPAKQVSLAMDILGRGGVKLLPALRGGSDSLNSVRKEAERLGVVMSEDTVQQFARVDDAFDGLKLRATGFRNIFAKAFAPEVEKSLKALTYFYDKNADKIEEISKRIASVVTKPFTLMTETISIAIKAFSEFFGRLEGWEQVLIGFGLLVAGLALAFLLPAAPILILTALIAAIMEDIQNFRDGMPSLIGDIVKEWDNFKFHIEDLSKETTGFLGVLTSLLDTILKIGSAIGSVFSGKGVSGVIDALTPHLSDDQMALAGQVRQARVTSKFGASPFANEALDSWSQIGNNQGPLPRAGGMPAVINQGAVNVQVQAGAVADPAQLSEMIAEKVQERMDFTAEEVASAFGRE